MELFVSLDIGTSSIRAMAITKTGELLNVATRIVPLAFPGPSQVEQDPTEILWACIACLGELETALGDNAKQVVALGITNQRESVVAWDRADQRILYPLISWQDGRTHGDCENLKKQLGNLDIKNITGLELNPYFSATKIAWLSANNFLATAKIPSVATLDAFIAWHLTGGQPDSRYITDSSNASRTLLMNLNTLSYDPLLLDFFETNAQWLPEIVPTAGNLLASIQGQLPFARTPISCLVGDQQASLFGNRCLSKGESKITHGTGTFFVTNIGQTRKQPRLEVLESVAWQIKDQKVNYCLEGTIFSSGTVLRWLRDEIHLLDDYLDLDQVLKHTRTSDGVVFVPAFTGLGTPYWNRDVRATIFGISSTTTPSHIIRAALEGICLRTQEVLDSIEQNLGEPVQKLVIDGGLTQSDQFCQLQADQLQRDLIRPNNIEATALGAAMLAGIGVDIIDETDFASTHLAHETFEAKSRPSVSQSRKTLWNRYLTRII